MRLEPKFPFNNPDEVVCLYSQMNGRKFINVFKNGKKILTTSYARYVYMTEIAHNFIPENYEVDHINGNCFDDSPNNLQLLTPELNQIKERYEYLRVERLAILICPYCGKNFFISATNYFTKLKNCKYIYCSRECGGYGNKKLLTQYTDYVGTIYRPYYEFFIGVTLNFGELFEMERIMILNNVKFIKHFRNLYAENQIYMDENNKERERSRLEKQLEIERKKNESIEIHEKRYEEMRSVGKINSLGRISVSKLSFEQNEHIMKSIFESSVDLTKFGWIEKVSKITGLTKRAIQCAYDRNRSEFERRNVYRRSSPVSK